MAYVDVTVIHPHGREYDGEIDENASYSELLSSLVDMLDLPTEEDDEEIQYRLSISGATRIEPGAVIRVERVTPPAVRRLKPK